MSTHKNTCFGIVCWITVLLTSVSMFQHLKHIIQSFMPEGGEYFSFSNMMLCCNVAAATVRNGLKGFWKVESGQWSEAGEILSMLKCCCNSIFYADNNAIENKYVLSCTAEFNRWKNNALKFEFSFSSSKYYSVGISFENFGKQLLGQDGQFANSNAWAPVDPQRLILGRPNHPMPDWQANQTRRANFQEMLLNHNANRIAAANRTLESSINLAARNPLLPKFHPLGSSGTFYPGHSYPKYNLNNVPITEANAPATATATFTNSFQSTPVKMDQLKFAGNQFHTIAESSSQTKDKQENLVSSKEKGIHEYCNELLQQIVDSSPAAISTACGDQKDSDSVIHGEGSGLGIDLNKTPDPKAHIRRKHRPKVIRERKPTRKPNLQKNEVTENPPKKRKYVRRTAKTPQADVITETNDSAIPTRKSSRKSLNFDLEKSGNEGQCRIVGQKEIQINKDHEKDFSSTSDNKAAEMLRGENVRHGTNSVLLIGQQDELPVGNQQSRNTDNITLQMNEKRTNAFSQGRKHSVSFSLVTEKGPTQGNSGCMPQYIQAEELRKFLLQSETSRISQNTKELICQSAYQSLSDIPSNSIEEKGSKRKHSSVDSEIDSAKTPKRTKKTLPRKVDGRSSSQIISKDESQKVRRKGKEVSQSQQSQPNEETPDSSTKSEIACRLSSLMISKMEGQSALVLYKGDGTIVPYKDAKKQKPKPKVDLDPQTERMWKLLMGKEGSSSIDGTDEEKELWEKERIVFRGRADSFIARMHLVQVRHASVQEISDTIKGRGMNNMLADRIKEFLNRVVNDHGSLDLEWLRHVPPDKVKDYLLSIRGLGLKSVECVRLLTLHHVAFPVDTNVGRIAVRLGWVPLQPLPESLQIHLLDQYPILEYELHYQMITFGKVFCTKTNPNCNACPMQAECRHFASAFASARLALPGPEEKGIVAMPVPIAAGRNPSMNVNSLYLPPPGNYFISEASPKRVQWEPIIELPKSPVRDLSAELAISDMEDFGEDPDETSSIESNSDEQKLWECMECCEGDDMSKALVVLTSHFASIPAQKLKYVSRLRTEHQVYELPDSHRLLEKMDKREPDDPSPYLLAIWAPGETANSTKLPERRCGSQDSGNLCNDKTCFSCNSIREADSRIVRGTILLFADHASSIEPINIPREWIWNLPRRTVYFGTSVASIFRGFVCVRGFDQQTRAPRPLVSRLHNVEKRAVKPKTNKKK
ncbi:hypothetical protein RIF29_21133 [Crotalaria pallida]|uniref:HhH-GPD domain-containing protein n=1 Tax=Crotalaria pallida TaxID=3830 RepID=A0AAN9I988_CROPI